MSLERGVNFFGSFETSDGIGRAAALNIKCLNATHLSMDTFVLSRPVALQSGKNTNIDTEFLSTLRHKINIFQFSARWVPHYFSRLADRELVGFYNIGYWFCEVPKIPAHWARQLEFFDEIWTASTFCQAAISRSANIPVIKIPLLIEPRETSHRVLNRRNRTSFPTFNFLTIFNTYSDAERKNVLFSIRAFLDAHGSNSSFRLIIKVSNLEHDPVLSQKLDVIRRLHQNVEIIEGYIENAEVQALYDQADVYVSLHRAEGFGLTISDAMSRSIPVIATGYSGNMEFCRSHETRLVAYELRTVGHERLRYRKNDIWAEPDMADAVSAFRELAQNYPQWLKKAAEARDRLLNEFSDRQVADLMQERIDLISSNFSFANDIADRVVDRDVGVMNTYGF